MRKACALAAIGMLVLAASASANHNPRLLDHTSSGPTGGNGTASFGPSLLEVSKDGRHAFFATSESLVSQDTDTKVDLYERSGGLTSLVSTGSAGGNGPHSVCTDPFYNCEEGISQGVCELPCPAMAVSDNGARVFFRTREQLVASDTDDKADIYERSAGTTQLISTGPASGNGARDVRLGGITPDGARVYFMTFEQLVPGDTNLLFDLYERAGGSTTLIGPGDLLHVSPNGGRILFMSNERLVSDDRDSLRDIYQSSGGAIELISTGPLLNDPDQFPADEATFHAASEDGTRVFFSTMQTLTFDDLDAIPDIYERHAGTTTRVSTGPNGGNTDALFYRPQFRFISMDGTRLFFSTREPISPGDTDTTCGGFGDEECVDVYERSNGVTTHLSVGPNGGNGPYHAFLAGVSEDGSRAFIQTEERLVAEDTDPQGGCFDPNEETGGPRNCSDVFERSNGVTRLISTGPNGHGPFDSHFVGTSRDGARVFFATPDALAANDVDPAMACEDVYFGDLGVVVIERNCYDVYERFADTTTLISTGPGGGSAPVDVRSARPSHDGRSVWFRTTEQLLGSDTDTLVDIYGARVGSHDMPSEASPLTVSLVPAFRQTITSSQCIARGGLNSSHGPPLAFASCQPPGYQDGTVAHMGPQGAGAAQLVVVPGDAYSGNGDQADVSITATVSDSRNLANGDYDPSAAPDATLVTRLRLSDIDNGASLNTVATMTDLNFAVPLSCTATAGPEGSTCSTATSADGVLPGTVKEGSNAVMQVHRMRVNDAGANGSRGDPDDRIFAQQGIYIP